MAQDAAAHDPGCPMRRPAVSHNLPATREWLLVCGCIPSPAALPVLRLNSISIVEGRWGPNCPGHAFASQIWQREDGDGLAQYGWH